MTKLKPVTNCWAPMMLIKKRIKRKSQRLNEYTIEAQQKLQEMRKLRNELLSNFRTLIDVKLKKVRTMTRGGGKMMRVYRIRLQRWRKYLREQQSKLKKLEKEELDLDRQLYQLRRQLGILPHRRFVMHSYLEHFNKALENSESARKDTTPEQRHLMSMELKNLISFLLKKPENHSIKYMKKHPISTQLGLDSTKFFKNEIRLKKLKQTHKHKHKHKPKSSSIGSIGSLSFLFRKESLTRKSKGKFVEMPSIRKLYNIKKKLFSMARKEARQLHKHLHKIKIKQPKPKRSKPNREVTLNDVLDLNLTGKGVPEKKKVDRLIVAKSTIRHLQHEMDLQSLESKLTVKSKKLLMRRIKRHEAQEKAAGDGKDKDTDTEVGSKMLEQLMKKRVKKATKKEKNTGRASLSIGSNKGEKTHFAEPRKESEVDSGDGDIRREPIETYKKPTKRDFKKSEKKLLKFRRKLSEESKMGLKVESALSQKEKESRKGTKKGSALDKRYEKEGKREGQIESREPSHSRARRRSPKAESTLPSYDYRPLYHASHDVNELMKNKSVPGSDIHTYRDQKSPHWKLFQRVLVSKKRKRMGLELMNMLEANPQPKLQPIQTLLKDVIKGPTLMDILADREDIMKLVGKHYMWKNLASVYYDLTSVGVGKVEIYKILKEQYLRYIDEIVAEAIDKGARVVSRSQFSSITEQFSSIGGSSDSFEAFMNQSKPKKDAAMKNVMQEIGARLSRSITPLNLAELHSTLSLELMGCKEATHIDQRYSLSNLKKIYDAHAKYFGCLDKESTRSNSNPLNQQEAAIAKELRRNRRAHRRKKRRQQKKVDGCRLYYEPTKTCRERSLEEDDDYDAIGESKCRCKPVCHAGKCARCGVDLPPKSISPKTSSSLLSLCSIAACGKNKELLDFTSDICDQCGFVHHQHLPCPTWVEACSSKTMQQLRRIRQFLNLRVPVVNQH